MMEVESFPTSIIDIENWCRRNNFKLYEGRQRYAEYAILSCIAADSVLSKAIVFKGGNALRFFFNSPRSTLDLDFSINVDNFIDNVTFVREKLNTALQRIEYRFGIKAKCQRVKRNPLREGTTRPTYEITVGYLFPDDRYFANFDDKNIVTVIHIDISLHDKVCEFISVSLANDSRGHLRVCNLEDILAEKLRALLQQPLRNRNRGQDVYDIALMFNKNKSHLEYKKIANYLQAKSEIRDIYARLSAFNIVVKSMAVYQYDTRIQEQTGIDFIPFNDAWELVLDLVRKLNLPD
jgi:predicted nucleotidyltransferase component of viral defense system